MARRRTPDDWQKLMDAAGFSSIRRMSEAAGLSNTGTTRVVHGDVTPDASTVSALASALRVPESTIYKLTHGRKIQTSPWEPPAEVHRLSKRTQDAFSELIRAVAAEQGQREDVMGSADSTAPMNEAGGTPAPAPPAGTFGSGRLVHTEEDTEDEYDLAADYGDDSPAR